REPQPAGSDRRAGVALGAFPDLVLAAHRAPRRARGREPRAGGDAQRAQAPRSHRRDRPRVVRGPPHRRLPRRPPPPRRRQPAAPGGAAPGGAAPTPGGGGGGGGGGGVGGLFQALPPPPPLGGGGGGGEATRRASPVASPSPALPRKRGRGRKRCAVQRQHEL